MAFSYHELNLKKYNKQISDLDLKNKNKRKKTQVIRGYESPSRDARD